MKWEFSDGTVVHLGGKVQGDSDLAKAIRLDVSRMKAGFPVLVQVDVCPSEQRRLELDDAPLFDAWLNQHSVQTDVAITSAPEVDPIERVGWPVEDEDDLPAGTVH